MFVTTTGEVLIYDAQGKRVRAMTLPEGAEVTSGLGSKATSAGSDGKNDDDDDEDGETKGGVYTAHPWAWGGAGRQMIDDHSDGLKAD